MDEIDQFRAVVIIFFSCLFSFMFFKESNHFFRGTTTFTVSFFYDTARCHNVIAILEFTPFSIYIVSVSDSVTVHPRF